MRKSLNLFSRTPTYDCSELVLLAVPWSATASFGGGAESGPEIIAHASSQMDFFSKESGKDIREKNTCFLSPPHFLKPLSQQTRNKALPVMALEEKAPGDFPKKLIDEINQSCAQMVMWVFEETKKIQKDGKKFGLVGGDHSTSEGAIRYFSEVYKSDLGILHIDAHADLRKSYQGFQHSHASVMRNIMEQSYPPAILVQVGVRDYCSEEYKFIRARGVDGSKSVGFVSSVPKPTPSYPLGTIKTFFDSDIKTAMFEGKTWKSIVDSIIQPLPEKVYISLDVDGLKPDLFPHTGTPVPGGLSFEQTEYLLNRLAKSHRHIIGFDLVEVADPVKRADIKKADNQSDKNILWDAQVGARLLLCLTQAIFH